VLDDLDAHGLAPGPLLRAELMRGREPIARVELDGATLEVSPAVAFWPLLGDVASQERSGARLVDSSSARVQLLVTVPRSEPAGCVGAAGWRVPLRAVPGPAGGHLGSVLYRTFAPHPGLHPGLAAQDPLLLDWVRGERRIRVELHSWTPWGGAYPGLPEGEEEARRRRNERVVLSGGVDREIRASRAAGFLLDIRCADAPASLARPRGPQHEP